MFLKMKSRVLRMLVCAAAGALCLYSGAACAATLYKKAHGQPYLLAGAERFDFTGYYMVAAMWGTVCVLLAVCLVLFIRRGRRAGT